MANQTFDIRLSLKDAETVKRGLASLGTDGERALKRIEAAARPAGVGLQALDKASAGLQGQVSSLASRAGVAGDALTALGKGGLAAAAGLGAVVLVAAKIMQATSAATQHFGEMADAAQRAGTTAEHLQVLQRAALENGVSVEELSRSLETLHLNISKAADGSAEMQQKFATAGIPLERLREIGNDTAMVLVELATNGATAAQQAELLGKTSKGMSGMMEELNINLDDTSNKLRDLGLIASNEVVASFDELADKSIKRLNEEFAKWSPVLLAVAEGMQTVRQEAWDLIDALKPLIEATNSFWKVYSSVKGALLDKEGTWAKARAQVGGTLAEITSGESAMLDRARAEGYKQPLKPLEINIGPPKTARTGGGSRSRGGGGRTSRTEEDLSGTVPMERLGTFSEELFQFEGDWKDVMDSINKEQQRQSDLWDAGVADRLQGLKQQEQGLISSKNSLVLFGEQLTSVEGMSQGVIQGIAGIGQTAISAFADAVVEGQNFSEMLDSLAKTIEKTLIQMTLQIALQQAIGGGAIGLGGLFGGGAAAGPQYGMMGAPYAKGGTIQSALPYGIYSNPVTFPMETPGFHPMARGMGLMAESGPEAVMPLRRTASGKLGVASAAPVVNVVVNNSSSSQVSEETRRGPGGEIDVIFDVVERRMAERMARPGTTLNRALGSASSPLRSR